MSSVVKFAKTIRNNWKKSAFALLAVSYGISYGTEKYKINCLMRTYCKEAVKYGDEPISATAVPKTVTVILNPAANKRSANDAFKKYCEPLLHLGGLSVNIISTTSEGFARKAVEEMQSLPDAILVAGGDGTLAETVTGMLRRSDGATCPIGVLPLGRCSNVGAEMFPGATAGGLKQASGLANAAMAVLQGKETTRDVMQIQVLEKPEADSEEPKEMKPVYAVGSLHWGAYRDAISSRDKYWYYGPLREYVTFLFNGYKDTLTWNCKALLSYSNPCTGCQNCMNEKPKPAQRTSWWRRFIPNTTRKQITNEVDYSKIYNKDCLKLHEKQIETLDFHLTTSKANESGTSALRVKLGPDSITYGDFVSEGWKRVKGDESSVIEKLDARMMEIIPETISTEEKPVWFAIDNEEYEVKPIRVTLIPNAIKVYCS